MTAAQSEPGGSVSDAPPVATVLGVEVPTDDPEELRYLILRPLTDRYASEHGIEVSERDVEDYLAGMARLAEKGREERRARREKIAQQLEMPSLTATERDAFAKELATLNQLDRDLSDISGANPPEAEEEREARRSIAAAFIRQWKINKALYEQYGGRIIFQQGGPEPLDAYRRFLEERQARGDFEIREKDLEDGFWHYYRTDTLHSFYAADSAEEKQAFATPWWLTE